MRPFADDPEAVTAGCLDVRRLQGLDPEPDTTGLLHAATPEAYVNAVPAVAPATVALTGTVASPAATNIGSLLLPPPQPTRAMLRSNANLYFISNRSSIKLGEVQGADSQVAFE